MTAPQQASTIWRFTNGETDAFKDTVAATRLFDDLTKVVSDHELKTLVGAVNVRGNHWQAIHVDVETGSWYIGDSLDPMFDVASAMYDPIVELLGQAGVKNLEAKPARVQHIGTQRDGHSCGAAVINAAAHLLLDVELICRSQA